MKILEIKEQENGSAILDIEMTEKEKNFIIEYGFNEMLKKSIGNFEKEVEGEERKCLSCDGVIEKELINIFPNTVVCEECLRFQKG